MYFNINRYIRDKNITNKNNNNILFFFNNNLTLKNQFIKNKLILNISTISFLM